jgi:hypothetical protein
MKERKASNTQGSAFRLLATLHGLFAELGTDRLKTETVLEMLAVSEASEEAWPADAATLAATLRGFAVYPRKIRLGKTTAQGYVASEVGRAYESLAADLVPAGTMPEHGEKDGNRVFSNARLGAEAQEDGEVQ